MLNDKQTHGNIYFEQIETKMVIYLAFLSTPPNTPDPKYPAEWQKCQSHNVHERNEMSSPAHTYANQFNIK
jgi:hypothetical protein